MMPNNFLIVPRVADNFLATKPVLLYQMSVLNALVIIAE